MATPVVDLTADLKLQNPTTAERQIREFERKVLANLRFGNGQPLGKLTAKVTEFDKSLEAANARVVAFGASATVIAGVTAAIREMVVQSIKVEKTLADINVLLGQSSTSLAKFSNSLFDIAKNTGQSFDAVAEAAKEFSRQGLSVSETLKRTSDALILTRLSGLDAAKAVDTLTASVNAFTKEGLDTTQIVNRLANVDAKFAVSSKDLSEALSRAGSSAQDAGVSFNELIALVTAVQQRTAAGGAKIGNALKSIFTRTQRSDTLDQFERLGIAVRDTTGATLPAVQILSQLAKAYDNLSDAQKSATSELVGGVYQINIVKSLFSDLGQVIPEYSRALDVANASTDEAIQRNEALNKTLASLANEAAQNFTKLSSAFGKLLAGPSLERIFGAFNSFSDTIDGEGIGEKIGGGILKGIGSALAGPGLVIGAVLGGKLLGTFTRFTVEALGTLTGVGKASERVQEVQAGINNLLREVPDLQNIVLSRTTSLAEKEAAILATIRAQATARAELAAITGQTAGALVQNSSLKYNPRSQTFRGRNVARGHVPVNSLPPQAIINEVHGAKKAGYSIRPSDVRAMKANIGGQLTTVVYNNKEKVIHDFQGSGEPAIIPPNKSLQQMVMGAAAGFISAAKGFAKGGIRYIYDDNDNVTEAKRLAARERGFELITHEEATALVKARKGRSGLKLDLIDPTATAVQSLPGGAKGVFNVIAANSIPFDKYEEAQGLGLGKVDSLKRFIEKRGLHPNDTVGIQKAISGEFGEAFVKHKASSGSLLFADTKHDVLDNKILHRVDGFPHPEDYFIQKKITGTTGREFRVNLAGVGEDVSVLGDAGFKGNKIFHNQQAAGISKWNASLMGAIRSGTFSDYLSRKVAIEQAKKSFKKLNPKTRGGAIGGFDVLQSNRTGLGLLGQLIGEKLGIKGISGGGVIEANFSQDFYSRGQAGSSGGLKHTNVLTAAARALLKNAGFAAGGYISASRGLPNLSGFKIGPKDFPLDNKKDLKRYLASAATVGKDYLGIKPSSFPSINFDYDSPLDTHAGVYDKGQISIFPKNILSRYPNNSASSEQLDRRFGYYAAHEIGHSFFEKDPDKFKGLLSKFGSGIEIPKTEKEAMKYLRRAYAGQSTKYLKDTYGEFPIEEALVHQFPSFLSKNFFAGGYVNAFGGKFNPALIPRGPDGKPSSLSSGGFRNVFPYGEDKIYSHPKKIEAIFATYEKAYGRPLTLEEKNSLITGSNVDKTIRAQKQRDLGETGIGPKVFDIMDNGAYVAERIFDPTLSTHFKNGTLNEKQIESVTKKARFALKKLGYDNADLNRGNIAYNPKTKGFKVLDFARGFIPLQKLQTVFGNATTPENSGLAKIFSRKTRGAVIRNLVAMKHPEINDNLLGGDLKRLLAHTSPDTLDFLVKHGAIKGVHGLSANMLHGASGFVPLGLEENLRNASQEQLQDIARNMGINPAAPVGRLRNLIRNAAGSEPQLHNLVAETLNPSASLRRPSTRFVQPNSVERYNNDADLRVNYGKYRAIAHENPSLVKAGLARAPVTPSLSEGVKAVAEQYHQGTIDYGTAQQLLQAQNQVDAARVGRVSQPVGPKGQLSSGPPRLPRRSLGDTLGSGIRGAFSYSDPAVAEKVGRLGIAGGALAFAGSAAGSLFANPADPLGVGNRVARGVSGASTAIGTGAALASVGGPAGAVVGGLVATFGSLKSVIDNLTPSLEDFDAALAAETEKRQAVQQSFDQLIQSVDIVEKLSADGAGATKIGRAITSRANSLAALPVELQAKIGSDFSRDNIAKVREEVSQKQARDQAIAETKRAALTAASKNTSVLGFRRANIDKFNQGLASINETAPLAKYIPGISSLLKTAGNFGSVASSGFASITGEQSSAIEQKLISQIDITKANKGLVRSGAVRAANATNANELLSAGGMAGLSSESIQSIIDELGLEDAKRTVALALGGIGTSIRIFAEQVEKDKQTASKISDLRKGALEREFAITKQIANLNFAEKLRSSIESAMDSIKNIFDDAISSNKAAALEGAGGLVSEQSRSNLGFALQRRALDSNAQGRENAIQRNQRESILNIVGQAGELLSRPDKDLNNERAVAQAVKASRSFEQNGFTTAGVNEAIGAIDTELKTGAPTEEVVEALKRRRESLLKINEDLVKVAKETALQRQLNQALSGAEKKRLDEARKQADEIAQKRNIGSLFNFDKNLFNAPNTSSITSTFAAQNTLLQFNKNRPYDLRRRTPEGRVAQTNEIRDAQIAAGRGLSEQVDEGFIIKRDQAKALLEKKGQLKNFTDFSKDGALTFNYQGNNEASYQRYVNDTVNKSQYGGALNRATTGLTTAYAAGERKNLQAQLGAETEGFLGQFQKLGLNSSSGGLNSQTLANIKTASAAGNIDYLKQKAGELQGSRELAPQGRDFLTSYIQKLTELQDKGKNVDEYARDQAFIKTGGVDVSASLTNGTFKSEMERLGSRFETAIASLGSIAATTSVSVPTTVSISVQGGAGADIGAQINAQLQPYISKMVLDIAAIQEKVGIRPAPQELKATQVLPLGRVQ